MKRAGHSCLLVMAFAASAVASGREDLRGPERHPDGALSTASYYVAPDGDDRRGDGSRQRPWATLGHAVRSVPDDGSEIVVGEGRYEGTQTVSRHFRHPLRIRAEIPYRAQLASSPQRHRALFIRDASNVILSGFEIVGTPESPQDYLVQITGAETAHILLEDNILHDSFRNDILKINAGAHQITVRGNLFYNQPAGGDEHIDINTVHDVFVEENVFFNDFAASRRPVANNTHPFVLIKNSGRAPVTRNFVVRGNVFLHWQGRSDQPFLLLGEDGRSFHEAEQVLIENNLFLGTSSNPMTAAFAVKGARDVVFRANTVHGPLPLGSLSWGYAMRLGREGANPPNEEIAFFNNIWSDPSGAMTRFSSGSPQNTRGAVLRNNLYFNGGEPIPVHPERVLNLDDDPTGLVADPGLPADLSRVVPPAWDAEAGRFADGSASVAEVRRRLVEAYGTPPADSPVVGRADPAQMPATDILGRPRTERPTIGAVEIDAP